MNLRLSIFAVVVLAAFGVAAWADEATPPPPVDAPPAPPKPGEGGRWITFSIGPSFDYLFDRASQKTLGKVLYGGDLRFRIHPVPWFAIGFNPGYLVGQQKSPASLGTASFIRNSSSSLTALNFGLYAQIAPFARVNPFVGVTGGGAYYFGRFEPENISSPVPLDHGELTTIVHRWLPMVGGEAGLDVRITPWFGAYAIGFYQYSGVVRAQLAIPGATANLNYPLSHAGASAGIIVYY